MLITFEGSEAVGKSTIIQHVAKFLDAQNKTYICTREPGGTPLAEKIRDLIFHSDLKPRNMTELLLMFAARRDHIDHIIAPALSDHKIVLCDRYIDSSYVYQSLMGHIAPEILDRMVTDFVAPYLPKVCFIIDCGGQKSFDRIQQRGIENANDARDAAYFEAIRQGFLRRAQTNLVYKYIVIDNNHDFKTTIQQIQHHLEGLVL